MPSSRTPAESVRLMQQETVSHYGPVPRMLGGHQLAAGSRAFIDGQFVLLTSSGFGYHYQPGQGITIELPSHGADPDEEVLWLNGSVYAAVACLNGLYPVHASAVAYRGRAYAFTGASGAGKSTLIAGLGQRGWPMFCDDTLLLDLSHPAHLTALPGHKRLKLTEHALELTGTTAQQPVGAETGKSYVAPPAGDWTEPLPLGALVFLEEGTPAAWSPLAGAERFARLADDHYTQDLYAEAQRPDRAVLFALRARIAGQVAMARLTRPRSPSGFTASLDLAEANLIKSHEEQFAR